MTRINKFLGFLMVLALAAFALPASAANPSKQYSVDIQSTGTVGYWTVLGTPAPGGASAVSVPAGGGIVYATITNQTPTGGNSAINSFVFVKPPGWTISGPYGKPAGVITDDSTGNLKVSNITGLQPKDVQGTHAVTISFKLTPTSCSSGPIVWAATTGTQYVIVTTGTFSSTTFGFTQVSGMNQTTTASGCGFSVNKAYDTAATNAVSVSLSCASGSVTPASASAAPGSPASFTVSGFSGNPNCTATETAASMPPGYHSTQTCSASLTAGSCTITNQINHYTLTYNAGTGGKVNGLAQVTQDVTYGGNGSAVTATADSGYRWVKWSPDNNTNATRTDTNITANLTVGAVFGGTLSFTTPPHDAIVGGQIGPVVVACNNFTSAPTVTLTIDSGGLTGTTTQPCVNGAATFNDVATAAGTPAGTHTFTATANDGNPASTSATAVSQVTLTASSGVLWCSDAGPPPSGTQIDFSDNSVFQLAGKRYPNKDGSPCIAVNFNVQVESTVEGNKVNILWDEVSQPNLTLKLEVTWPPELVGGDLLPKPTLYNIGSGTYTVGTCLKKNPPAPSDPDNPPEQIGTVASFISASTSGSLETIALTPNVAWPTAYPFSIIIRSDSSAQDPERMLVTGSPSSGTYSVVRGTGLTQASAHSAGLLAMWTPLPLDNGSGTNAPAGGQDQVCSISDTYAATADPLCPAQPNNAEPVPCMQATQKLWAIGDLLMTR